MRQEALENLFAKYIDEGKWDEKDVPKGLRENVQKKVKELKENRGPDGTDEKKVTKRKSEEVRRNV